MFLALMLQAMALRIFPLVAGAIALVFEILARDFGVLAQIVACTELFWCSASTPPSCSDGRCGMRIRAVRAGGAPMNPAAAGYGHPHGCKRLQLSLNRKRINGRNEL